MVTLVTTKEMRRCFKVLHLKQKTNFVIKGAAIAKWICLCFHPAVPGLNPKHTIYYFKVKFCTNFVIVLRT